ncbi:flagellar basal body-associated FliL family protein [Wenzhouxiangella limi]|uniref:Flagellar protein FliL n=1 Tax=Wenzhouxiangella limi TaxID=2707351 RepID=A0A845V347_9GAMM|nr:flagellar basal body-associated FliL family protein [Wenzhouxiangella limi]NDY97144.1 flagellar basal body protein FliL [Wenzhouxiangella limi]
MARGDNRQAGRRRPIDDEPEEEVVEEQPKSRKKMWIIIISLSTLLLLGGGGAGAYFFVFAEDDPLGLFGGGEAAANEPEPRQPPIYYGMDPAFVNNLSGTGGRRFMQVNVQLMARDPEVIAAVERHEPVIRNDLIMLFSDQTLESVDTTEGKEALRRDSLETVREILGDNDEPDEVEELFFTSFIVQ